MGFNSSLRIGTMEALEALSPIHLFNVQQAKKLAVEAGDKFSTMAFPMRRPEAISRSWEAVRSSSMNLSSKAGKWWSGQYLDRAVPEAVANRNLFYRRTAVGLLGAAVAAPVVMGQDSLLSRVGQTGAKFGLAAGLAGGAAEWGARQGMPRFGTGMAAGILGFTAMSYFRN